jgi:hypothetical protein
VVEGLPGEQLAGSAGLIPTAFAERDILPTGVPLVLAPFGVAVAEQKNAVTHW